MQLTISLPDCWTVGHWTTYVNGRSAYIAACEHDSTPPNAYLADYYGALALIRAGIVHVRGVEQISQQITEILARPDQSLTDLAVIGLVVREIACPIEAALTLPLDF